MMTSDDDGDDVHETLNKRRHCAPTELQTHTEMNVNNNNRMIDFIVGTCVTDSRYFIVLLI